MGFALNDGGHPEIAGQGGELFNKVEEINGLLEKIIANYEDYQSSINLLSMEEAGNQYYEFFQEVLDEVHAEAYVVKKMSILKIIRLKGMLLKLNFVSVWQWKIKAFKKVLDFFNLGARRY